MRAAFRPPWRPALSIRPDLAPPVEGFADLRRAAEWSGAWLKMAALPLWGGVGVDPTTGAYREALTWAGEPHDPRCRARVQARQAFVFASAARAGLWPSSAAARGALDLFLERAARGDGLFMAVLDPTGAPVDGAAYLYEHAFLLLALSALGDEDRAVALRGRLEAFRHPVGGFREAGERPFQANAQMHLLEAALDWEAATVLGNLEAEAPGDGIAVIIDWEGITAVDLLGPAASLPDAAGEAGAVAWEVERIRAGVPAMGSEIDEDTIPNATGQVERSVSFTKGCFTGQELVARIDSRTAGAPTRLVRISGNGPSPPTGADLGVEDKVVGTLTSVVDTHDGFLALGYRKRSALDLEVAEVRWEGGPTEVRLETA